MWQASLLCTLALLPWGTVAAPHVEPHHILLEGREDTPTPTNSAPGGDVTAVDSDPSSTVTGNKGYLTVAVNAAQTLPPYGLPSTQTVAFGPTDAPAPTIGGDNIPTGTDVEAAAQSLANNAPPISVPNGPAEQGPNWGARPGEYLYVWAGAEGRYANDRLVTLDFDYNSPNYGRIISQAEVPTSGNEPHHCGLSNNKQRLLCGGFFSVLKRNDDIFVFDLSDPANPKFMRSNQGQYGAVPDDFIPLSDNTFILSYMGNKRGGTPGRVARVDADGNFIGEYPRPWEPLPDSGYNPHGVAVREDLNLFVSSDFLDAGTAMNNNGGDPVFRNTIRVWDLNNMRILYSIRFPDGTATMDCKLMHTTSQGIGFVGGTGNGKIYVFNTDARQARLVIDLNLLIVPPPLRSIFQVDSQMMQISPDDTRFYIPYASKNDKFTGKSGFYSGIAVFDVSNPYSPVFLQNVAMPRYAGPHLGQLYGDRYVSAGYFLDMDNFGKVHLNGDHFVRTLLVQPDGTLVPDNRFQVDFNRLVPGLELRPHGLASLKI